MGLFGAIARSLRPRIKMNFDDGSGTETSDLMRKELVRKKLLPNSLMEINNSVDAIEAAHSPRDPMHPGTETGGGSSDALIKYDTFRRAPRIEVPDINKGVLTPQIPVPADSDEAEASARDTKPMRPRIAPRIALPSTPSTTTGKPVVPGAPSAGEPTTILPQNEIPQHDNANLALKNGQKTDLDGELAKLKQIKPQLETLLSDPKTSEEDKTLAAGFLKDTDKGIAQIEGEAVETPKTDETSLNTSLRPQIQIPTTQTDAQTTNPATTSVSTVDPANNSQVNYGMGRVVDESGTSNTADLSPEQKKQVKSVPQPVTENKPARWKAALGMALAGIAQSIRSGRPLGEALGEGLGGGLGGAIFPQTFADRQKEFADAKLEAKQKREFEAKQREQELDYRKAQTANVYADNERADAERTDRKLKTDRQLKEQKRANFYRQNKYFDPARATEAQRRQLAEFDETPETIGKYDFSKPEFKQIGDSTYRWSSAENAFVDTNLPPDKSKAFTEVVVTDPETKKSYTLITTQEKAAVMINSRQVAGLQIEAARERQINQQTWASTEKEKDRAFDLKKQAIDQKFRAEQEKLKQAQDDAKNAQSVEQRQAAETRAEESRKRILDYQTELQKEIYDYKKSKEE